jgi:hypothetical protein
MMKNGGEHLVGAIVVGTSNHFVVLVAITIHSPDTPPKGTYSCLVKEGRAAIFIVILVCRALELL